MRTWKHVSPKKLSARKRGVFPSKSVLTKKPVADDSEVCPICGEKMTGDLEYVGHNPEILAAIASGIEGDFAADVLEDGKPVWIPKHKRGHRGGKVIG